MKTLIGLLLSFIGAAATLCVASCVFWYSVINYAQIATFDLTAIMFVAVKAALWSLCGLIPAVIFLTIGRLMLPK